LKCGLLLAQAGLLNLDPAKMAEPIDEYLAAMRSIVAGELLLKDVISLAARLSAANEKEAARKLYRAWISANPDHALAYVSMFNCAALEAEFGDKEEAISLLTSATTRNPAFLAAYVNLANAYEQTGRSALAIETLAKAVKQPAELNGLNVSHATTAYRQLTRIFADLQLTASAEEAVTQCLEIAPNQTDALEQLISFRLAQCKWPILEPLAQVSSENMLQSMHPLSMAVFTDDPLLQLAAADRYVRQQPVVPPGPEDRRHATIPIGARRLRIGYVSSDFRDHAIGYLMAELFEQHDVKNYEIFAYYCGPKTQHSLTARIRASIEHWADIRQMSDSEAAAKIADDGIDILVDVNGHTRDARPGVFARRPAPVLVNWLGFPGSMGSPLHHYVIADNHIIPPELEKYYSERVLRLPCYQPNDRKRVVGNPVKRSEVGLPDDAFVFCCFNGLHKISRFTFDRWMDVLRRVDGSVMWLLETQPQTQARLAGLAQERGVDGSRLIFAPRLNNASHLARYPLADLFLDTSPYGAHTTASDALWMGVPVLTLPGRSFASRVCASLVSAAGLPELVVGTSTDYVRAAIRLAQIPEELRALRARLTASRNTAVLFDTTLLARSLERLYRQMALEARAGCLPAPDLTNLEAYLSVGATLDHETTEMSARTDYEDLYRTALARRHLARPIAADQRLWTKDAMEEAERAFALEALSRILEPDAPQPVPSRVVARFAS
jgi:predicted O-linked N-acetylglucosamine transferase (SPINDLY family)